MNVYKINDIISCEFLKIPKSMFANEKYRKLSSDAKLTYALLYDRLSLSKLNGWINDDNEVFLIYTREEVAEDLCITYKKAISAFKELLGAGLIAEQRCGRGMPNKIYIVKPELSENDAKKYAEYENLRTAKSVCQENKSDFENCQNSISSDDTDILDVPNRDIKNSQNGISRTAELEYQELPNQHTIKTNISNTNINHIDYSQYVNQKHLPDKDGQMDEIYNFNEILKRCELDAFEPVERKILYDAIERLYYSQNFKIGTAVLPQSKVRAKMYELNFGILYSALQKLHANENNIKNITGYVMSTIFNCITEEYSLLHIDPYLNQLRRQKEE